MEKLLIKPLFELRSLAKLFAVRVQPVSFYTPQLAVRDAGDLRTDERKHADYCLCLFVCLYLCNLWLCVCTHTRTHTQEFAYVLFCMHDSRVQLKLSLCWQFVYLFLLSAHLLPPPQPQPLLLLLFVCLASGIHLFCIISFYFWLK